MAAEEAPPEEKEAVAEEALAQETEAVAAEEALPQEEEAVAEEAAGLSRDGHGRQHRSSCQRWCRCFPRGCAWDASADKSCSAPHWHCVSPLLHERHG